MKLISTTLFNEYDRCYYYRRLSLIIIGGKTSYTSKKIQEIDISRLNYRQAVASTPQCEKRCLYDFYILEYLHIRNVHVSFANAYRLRTYIVGAQCF